jgi:hypothetical protein
VVTSETQLATNSFRLCIDPPSARWRRKLNTIPLELLPGGEIGDRSCPANACCT